MIALLRPCGFRRKGIVEAERAFHLCARPLIACAHLRQSLCIDSRGNCRRYHFDGREQSDLRRCDAKLIQQMNRIAVRVIAVVALIAGVLAPSPASAQEGSVLQGKVLDAATGEPLIGAQVVVTGAAQGTITDVDGQYRLALAAGTYSLDVQYLGYQAKTVTGIAVAGGAPSFQDIALEPEAVEAEGIRVVITAEEERG